MLWLLIILVIGLLVWAHIASGMNVKDRVDVALEIARSSKFSQAEGFAAAAQEDPDLVGWVQAGTDCIMLFCPSPESPDDPKLEIVDFSSTSIHPGLVIHYCNGVATRTDAGELTDKRIRHSAAQLLRETKHIVALAQGHDDFGFRN